jgi:hypothetical protein
MATRLTHITTGQAGLHADTSAALTDAITTMQAAGYTVSDIEDDADEPIHAAIIHYTGGPQTLRTLKGLIA